MKRYRHKGGINQILLLAFLASGCPQTPAPSARHAEPQKEKSQAVATSQAHSSEDDAKPPAIQTLSESSSEQAPSSSQGHSDESSDDESSVIQDSQRLFKSSQSKAASGRVQEAFADASKAWSLIKDVEDPEVETTKGEIVRHLETLVSDLKENNEEFSSDQTRPLLLK